MAAGIPIDSARLLSCMLAFLCYGLFTAFAAAAVYSLVTKKGKLNVTLLATVLAMYSVATAHLVIISFTAFQAFDGARSNAGGPLMYYLSLSKPFKLAQGTLAIAQVLIGDSFLVYRCYVVWGRTRLVVVLPLLLLIGTVVTGVGETVMLATTIPGTPKWFSTTKPWITTAVACTFCTNALCTGLIAFKLRSPWSRLGGVSDYAGRPRDRVTVSALAIMIESAVIYLMAVTVVLFCNIFGSNGETVMADMLPSVIGITFTAIIIRIAFGLSTGDRAHRNPAIEFTDRSREVHTIGGSRRLVSNNSELEMSAPSSPMAVSVDRYAEAYFGDAKGVPRMGDRAL